MHAQTIRRRRAIVAQRKMVRKLEEEKGIKVVLPPKCKIPYHRLDNRHTPKAIRRPR